MTIKMMTFDDIVKVNVMVGEAHRDAKGAGGGKVVILVGDIRAWSEQEAGADAHETREDDAGWLPGRGEGEQEGRMEMMSGGTGKAQRRTWLTPELQAKGRK